MSDRFQLIVEKAEKVEDVRIGVPLDHDESLNNT